MPTKIRLQRHGKKGQSYFHIVIADGRAPRDGKFIEKIGTYNPGTNPATIELDTDKALQWLNKGAQPTDTCRAILSYRGVMYRNHLNKGVTKGALTQEQADAKFEKWLMEKEGKINAKKDKISNAQQEEIKKRLAAETAVKEAKAQAISAKNSPLAEEVEATAETEEPKAEATEEAPKAEAKEEAPKAEAKEETPKAEAKEEAPKAEAKEEAPKAEAKEETPKAEAKEEAPKAEAKEEAPKAEAKEEAPKEEAKEEAPKAEEEKKSEE